MEFQRNKERFNFLKWGAKALKNMLIVPPGSGIVHQVCKYGVVFSLYVERGQLQLTHVILCLVCMIQRYEKSQ